MSVLEVLKPQGRYHPAGPVADSATAERALLPVLEAEAVRKACLEIEPALRKVTCYDVMGNSTLVVVVEEYAPLSVPFIAAQETQVSTCYIWSSDRRCFTGVLTTTDYLKVLMGCDDNPGEADAIAAQTIKQWQETTRGGAGSGSTGGGGDEDAKGSSSSEAQGGQLIAAGPDETVADVIARMLQHKVRRIAVVADDPSPDVAGPSPEGSILSVLTFETLVQVIVDRLFAAADASGTLDDARDATLPKAVQSILGDDTCSEKDGPDAAEYASIFDVPYCRLAGLGHAARHKAATGAYPPPLSVTPNEPTANAFRTLLAEGLHALAVVDRGVIVDTISRNDVMRVEADGVFNLQVSVREALSFHHHQAAAAAAPTIAVFYPTHTLREIIIHFARRRVPVLFLVDPETDALVAQLELQEIFAFLSESAA